MTRPLRVRRAASFENVRCEWEELAESAGGIFRTQAWAEAWWHHYGQGRQLLLHVCETASGEPVAILPLYLSRRRPRVIRFVGHGPGDELGPVFAPGAEADAARGLLLALTDLEWDVFLGEQLPGGGRWSEQMGGQRWRYERSPSLSVPGGGWEAYLAERSANFRQQLARRRRRLEESGAPVFRLADERTLEGDLDVLFRLHRARWRGAKTDFADTPFQRDVARTALSRGQLRLWLLELDGRPVAAWHGFHASGVTSYYQAGREPEADRLSVGFVLLAHTLRAAMEEGATEYRFGRGGEDFKYRFTDHDCGLETVVLRRGLTGRSALAVAAALRQLRRARRRAAGVAHGSS